MLKKLAYIFVFLSVILTVSHSIIGHHHHFETADINSHQNDTKDDEHDHSIFSFGQLDESFIFSHHNTTIANDVNTILFIIPCNKIRLKINFLKARIDFITREEFPPPKEYYYSISYRGPPTS